MSFKYETVSEIIADRDRLRAERAALIRERNLAWTQLADARVLLREARAALPDMRHTEQLCVRIAAALAKEKT